MSENDAVKLAFVCVLVALILGMVIGKMITSKEIHHEAVRQGYAEYNATNGVWQWKSKEGR